MATTTSLLPPSSAIRLTWALTGAFSNDENSNQNAMLAELKLKEIALKARETGGKENQYILDITPILDASRRSLDIVHKGRQLNFIENEKLRSSSLEAIKDSLEFGSKTKDFLKALPTMTLTGSIGTGGVIAIAELLKLDGVHLWLVGLFFAAAGYFINLELVKKARIQKQQYYITQDYERSLYYEQYVSRVSIILQALYLELDNIHKNIFGVFYSGENQDEKNSSKEVVDRLLTGISPVYCKYIHQHIREKKVSVEEWTICEAGCKEARKACPHWE